MKRSKKKRSPRPSKVSQPVDAAPSARSVSLLPLKPWQSAALILTCAAILFAWLSWSCVHDSKINFLPRDARAEWILFPRPMEAAAHGVATLDTVFRREFETGNQPQAAQLNFRAAKRAEIIINGTPVENILVRNWKDILRIDVTPLLRSGKNNIEVRVFNDSAPPALWLAISVADRPPLRTDGSWEASFAGSAWRPAALATTPKLPGPGNPMSGGERVFSALRAAWPIWLIFAGIAAGICFALRRWFASDSANALSQRQVLLLLSVIGVLWLFLFANNGGLMPFLQGFDSQAHLDYIQYVQQRHALPLPNEGFEMFQPPLYYMLSAAALSLGGLAVDSQAGILVLRFLTLIFCFAQVVLVFLSLRLCFPGRLAAQLVGLTLAAFLPMQLYPSHYVTNETLAGTMVTASVFLGLRLLLAKNPSSSQFGWLGLCLGAAMLTKATALLLIPPLGLALVSKLAVSRAPMAIWFRHLGVLSAAFLATCGWHYLRIWRAFGAPIVGNWEAASGFSWWQDPGFHIATDYFRFGKSLVAPLFSGFWSFADGIYSTLWGDGLCGGVPNLAYRSPWNHNLMAAGYLLALVPTLIILVGLAVALWRFVRKPSAEWLLLIGLTGAVVFGVVFMTLKVASYAQIKAFYGLAVLVPLCFFGAIGWDSLTRGRRIWQGALAVLLMIWAMNSFATFWIVRSASQHIYLGLRFELQRKLDVAKAEADKAVSSDPSSSAAQRFIASVLTASGHASEALPHAQRAVELSPMESESHGQLGMVRAEQGQLEAAIAETRRALELGPESSAAYNSLLVYLSKSGRQQEAISAAREALTVSPFSVELHHGLGVALAQAKDLGAASRHFTYALVLRPDSAQARSNFQLALRFLGTSPGGANRLREVESFLPDTPVILNELAWFYATQSDATQRNGTEGVRLAEQAARLTNRVAAPPLASLAAAYAEAGRIPEAINVAEEARARARSSGDGETAGLTDKLLAAFRENRPYREEPRQK